MSVSLMILACLSGKTSVADYFCILENCARHETGHAEVQRVLDHISTAIPSGCGPTKLINHGKIFMEGGHLVCRGHRSFYARAIYLLANAE